MNSITTETYPKHCPTVPKIPYRFHNKTFSSSQTTHSFHLTPKTTQAF